jgi:hypothetical protein
MPRFPLVIPYRLDLGQRRGQPPPRLILLCCAGMVWDAHLRQLRLACTRLGVGGSIFCAFI